MLFFSFSHSQIKPRFEMTKFLLNFFLLNTCCLLIASQSNLTLDAFFNYTTISSLSLASTGDFLLVEARSPQWDLNTYEDSLWLCTMQKCNIITNRYFPGMKYKWSPDGNTFVFLMKSNSTSNTDLNFSYLPKLNSDFEPKLYFYSIKTEKITSISIDSELPTALTWAKNDSSIYYSTVNVSSLTSTIHELDLTEKQITKKDIVQVPFLIPELVYSSTTSQLIFLSASLTMEYFNNSQIYSYDLQKSSSIKQLTNDSSSKTNLQLRYDRTDIFFLCGTISLAGLTQPRLYSLSLITGERKRWFEDLQGAIQDYAQSPEDHSVYSLCQSGLEIQIYSQNLGESISKYSFGAAGSYLSISISTLGQIAFVFTDSHIPQEVYFIQDIEHLNSAIPLTHFNAHFENIRLPRSDSYKWKNPNDNQTIEGNLYYPPGVDDPKNLPLLVLIHGGPTGADVRNFVGHWYYWAPLAAAQGWLVLQPNYRGSTGYGDEFVNQIRYEILTKPSKDILSGIDQLVADQYVDPNRISVGGYSYGGILTNWLITQTTRFKAALSGAGSVEHVSFWGMQDTPAYLQALLGGFPWEQPALYQNQSAIYHFDRIRTPTHIVAGTADVRVPFSQSLMLERSLRQLGIPVQLLLLPNEQHVIANNPWHGKIKVREELEWLKRFG